MVVKIELEIATDKNSKVSEVELSNYVLRAIAGVAASNKGMVASYTAKRSIKRSDPDE